MKFLKRARNRYVYQLNMQEAMCLRALIKQFPLTSAAPVKISRTESGGKVTEREELLNESLAEHRDELRQKAGKFLAARRLRCGEHGWRLRVDPEEREMLLQLLNDIRVESWRALGEPEDLESQTLPAVKTGLNFHTVMQLAGFFEFELLKLESGDQAMG
jgi:hypothetical protein